MLPMRVVEPLRQHLNKVQHVHQGDLAEGFGEANLPFVLARKYPNAAKEWGWQFVFPSGNRSQEPRGHGIYRHHLHEKTIQRAVREAARRAGLIKHATPRYVIPLPRIFWRQARTFAPCRSCSATRT